MSASKRPLILGLLLVSLVLLLASTQVWVGFELAEGAAAVDEIELQGQNAGLGTMPIAIALIAISVVLAISGRIARVVLSLLAALLGGWVAYASWRFIGGSRSAVIEAGSGPLSEATGLGDAEHEAVVSAVHASPWPIVAAVAGAVVVLLAVAVLVLGRAWGQGGRKYGVTSRRERVRAEDGDRIAEWDALSEGDDPTSSA